MTHAVRRRFRLLGLGRDDSGFLLYTSTSTAFNKEIENDEHENFARVTFQTGLGRRGCYHVLPLLSFSPHKTYSYLLTWVCAAGVLARHHDGGSSSNANANSKRRRPRPVSVSVSAVSSFGSLACASRLPGTCRAAELQQDFELHQLPLLGGGAVPASTPPCAAPRRFGFCSGNQGAGGVQECGRANKKRKLKVPAGERDRGNQATRTPERDNQDQDQD